MSFALKSYRAPLTALVALWVICLLVSITGGLPERLGSHVGQYISHTVHFVFLVSGLAWILFSPLAKGETRSLRCLVIALALTGYGLSVEGLKHLFYLPRPGQPSVWEEGSRGSGFPSGHTVPAFIVACVVSSISPRLTIPAFTVAVLIGYSRVEVTAHYAYQVVISGIIGVLIGLAICEWRNKKLSDSSQKELASPSFP